MLHQLAQPAVSAERRNGAKGQGDRKRIEIMKGLPLPPPPPTQERVGRQREARLFFVLVFFCNNLTVPITAATRSKSSRLDLFYFMSRQEILNAKKSALELSVSLHTENGA